MIDQNRNIIVLIILHIVGLVGIIVFDSDLILSLTPINLIVSGMLIIPKKRSVLFWWTLGAAFSIGMSIEILGVATGFPFGNYSYGEALGPKLAGVPLVIGLNWWLLAYSGLNVSKGFRMNKWIIISLAALFMLVVDILIEQVAHKLDFWYWSNNEIPLENYLSWFAVGWVICYGLYQFSEKEVNRNAIALFFVQACFFLLLNIFL